MHASIFLEHDWQFWGAVHFKVHSFRYKVAFDITTSSDEMTLPNILQFGHDNEHCFCSYISQNRGTKPVFETEFEGTERQNNGFGGTNDLEFEGIER